MLRYSLEVIGLTTVVLLPIAALFMVLRFGILAFARALRKFWSAPGKLGEGLTEASVVGSVTG